MHECSARRVIDEIATRHAVARAIPLAHQSGLANGRNILLTNKREALSKCRSRGMWRKAERRNV